MLIRTSPIYRGPFSGPRSRVLDPRFANVAKATRWISLETREHRCRSTGGASQRTLHLVPYGLLTLPMEWASSGTANLSSDDAFF